MTLDELAIKYKTDKSSKWHGFTKYYEKYLESWRDKKFKLLEIGISSANSLKMWRDFFPQAEITGIDIDRNSLKYREDGFNMIMCDQSDSGSLTTLSETVGPFDIVIDDGSHRMDHIIISFETLFPLLNNGGLYIVEDLHTCYLSQYNPNKVQDALSYFQDRINDINLGGKNINGDFCGDRQRQFSRLEGKIDFTQEELSIEAINFYKSMVFIEKKVLEKNSNIEKEFIP